MVMPQDRVWLKSVAASRQGQPEPNERIRHRIADGKPLSPMKSPIRDLLLVTINR
jgi:hypothetical protein